MLDRELIRHNPELLKESLTKRGEDVGLVKKVLELDHAWRKELSAVESLRSQKNSQARGGKPTAAALKAAQALSKKLNLAEQQLAKKEQQLQELLLRLPNLVADDVPPGGDESSVVIETVGKPKLETGKPHHELMQNLGWLDIKTAAHFSGSRFRYLKGAAALAHMKLVAMAMELAQKNKFTPVIPPVLTRDETLEKAGFFPAAKDDIFKIEGENLYLTGTSEQTLLALGADTVFNETELPIRYVGFSSCFRREVGSYGKDVEGMFRQHQFDKVEMIVITTPTESDQEHDRLIEIEEKLIKELGLAYQKVMIAAAELGPTASKKIDLETWFPSQKRYRETHSASNCTDYQARRFNIKYRDASGAIHFAHTLNATLVTERLLLAAIENNQRDNGSVELPRSIRA